MGQRCSSLWEMWSIGPALLREVAAGVEKTETHPTTSAQPGGFTAVPHSWETSQMCWANAAVLSCAALYYKTSSSTCE